MVVSLVSRKLVLSLAFFAATLASSRALSVALEDIFPGDKLQLNEKIPSPAAVLGKKVGERHAEFLQLQKYYEMLAESSDRFKLTTIGKTHEGRPLLLAYISSPENLAQLEEIRLRRLASLKPDSDVDTSELPAVVWLGYSIHGNEPTGANAALLVAQYLTAAQDEETKAILENTIILFDPCANPDGLNRYSSWVNRLQSNPPVSDPHHAEHHEPWPNGRTNHYWFDLNRDWIAQQQPESQARVAVYHQWKPNVLADFHEMRSASSYYFSPGDPRRHNPLTPEKSHELTALMAKIHASALDKAGSLYFSKERYDEFSYNKGATYPDINGGVGFLFEQASSAGKAFSYSGGRVQLKTGIRNHVVTSLSTLQGAYKYRTELTAYQREFYRSALELAAEEITETGFSGYSFSLTEDPARVHQFLEILLGNDIEVYQQYDKTYYVPFAQHQHRLVKELFSPVKDFGYKVFYDISTSVLPQSFSIPYELVNQARGERVIKAELPKGRQRAKSELAYMFGWESYYAPRVLAALLKHGIKARVATKSVHSGRQFFRGSIVIPRAIQKKPWQEIEKQLEKLAEENALEVYAVDSGFSESGPDLGSSSWKPIKKPKPLLLIGEGMSPAEAGEIWHLLSHRFHIPLAMYSWDTFAASNLKHYTHIILVSGNYEHVRPEAAERLKHWVESGGTVIALQKAINWLIDKRILPTKVTHETHEETHHAIPAHIKYEDQEEERAKHLVPGAVFKAQMDLSNPLCYGFGERSELCTFRTLSAGMNVSAKRYKSPIVYDKDPLVSGYASEENQKRLAESGVVNFEVVGHGKVITMIDNPNFRGYWLGSQKVFLNALFFGSLLESPL